ncbi:MAG TPA: 2-amino-4-hydroxy-6-hydroxymethyldihydropteridine diphosphokinase, partial [Saprospiraceae bacterium]|nr:2-amino-4-hydroxy-6-hydroxymethyldihydropteridine diphosphokinase [Saprospiraceae bacterium]
RLGYLNEAIRSIESNIGSVPRQSKIYETEPWGIENQNMFLNMVVEVSTDLSAFDLLTKIKRIEQSMGRVKTEKWGPRRIDIDILTYGDQMIDHDNLKIPHAQLNNRNFVLIPLMELEPDLLLPGYDLTVEELYEISKDPCEVYIYEP